MDPQVRNFRDFLMLYNKLTEMCFNHCTDNFNNRNVSLDESACIDKCVLKFSNVNQKIMNVYVEAQTAINQRRLTELETQMAQAQAAELQQQSIAKLDTGISAESVAISPAEAATSLV